MGQGRTRQSGLTLLEVLVSLSLLGVVMLASFSALNVPFRAYLAGRDIADEQQNARFVLEWMVRRIRVIGLGYDKTLAEPAAVREAGANSLAFLADADGDGNQYWYRYCRASGTVYEHRLSSNPGTAPTCGTGAGAAPLTSRGIRPVFVETLDFKYFDNTETQLSSTDLATETGRAQIARVQIALGLAANRPVTGGPGNIRITINATLRN